MCGIAGAVGVRPGDDRIDRAVAAIRHRGPDAEAVWREADVCLIHTRLSIIDLSPAGAQPMRDQATGVTLVYNGEIYNHRALREAHLTDVPFVGASDSEVLLKLYLRFGLDAVEMLQGMFAFAIWDPRDRRLHLARDRFGIKPLVYGRRDGALYFGSEAKPLLALGMPARANRTAIRDYLISGRLLHTPHSWFEGIESLPPGCVASWSPDDAAADSFHLRRYWDPSAPTDAPAGDDPEDAIRALFEASIDGHLIADRPVAVSLSAGLDSQMITRALASLGRGDLKTFTYGFEDARYDESGPVLAADYGVPLDKRTLRIEPDGLLSDLEKAIEVFETPMGGLGTFGSYKLMQAVRAADVPVMLCGEGADEVFAGYQYYYKAHCSDLAAAGRLEALRAEIDAYNARHPDAPLSVEEVAHGPAQDGVMRAPDGTALGGGAPPGAALADLPDALPAPPAPQASSALRQAMLDDLTRVKLPKLLHFQDRASMASGVETRVPFLDHRLVEAVSALPGDLLIRDGVSKRLPKRILGRFFGWTEPADAVKRYVATPQREWLKGPLSAPVSDYLSDGAARSLGVIDLDGFFAAYDRYRRDPALGNSFFVWKAMNVEAFLRRFFPTDLDAGRA